MGQASLQDIINLSLKCAPAPRSPLKAGRCPMCLQVLDVSLQGAFLLGLALQVLPGATLSRSASSAVWSIYASW